MKNPALPPESLHTWDSVQLESQAALASGAGDAGWTRMGQNVTHSAKHLLDLQSQVVNRIPNLPAALKGSDEKGKDGTGGASQIVVHLVVSAPCVLLCVLPPCTCI